TFSGRISLQNNLTVTQAATTGSNALNLTGGMFAQPATLGPNDHTTTVPNVGAENTGFQTVTFAGPGRINATGLIADLYPVQDNTFQAFRGVGGVLSIASAGGTTNISASANYSGNTTVAGGTLILGKNAQNNALNGPGKTVVNSGLLALDYSGGGSN